MSLLDKKTTGMINRLDLKQPGMRVFYWLLFLICMLVVFISVIPPMWVLISSLKDTKEFFGIPPTIIPKSLHPEKIVKIWEKVKFGKYTVNSVIMVSGAVACAILINGLTAFVLSVLKPKGSKIVMSMILWSMMVPATISLVPLFTSIVNLGMQDRYVTLWLSYGANAFWVVLFKGFFDGLPRSYIEAARLDGAGSLGIFFRIVLPLSKSVCGVVAIFATNAAWSDFLLPYLVLKDKSKVTVIVKLFLMRNDGTLPVDYLITALLFASIPPLILFAFFQKQITHGIALGGIKG